MNGVNADSGSGRGDDSPVSQLRAATSAADVLALLAVPLVLCLVFLSPSSVRTELVFEYADPSLFAAFSAAYVHLEAGHLLVNVGSYLLVIPLAYALSVLSGHRRRFFVVFVTFIVAFPFVLAYLNLAIVRAAVTYGFSGVVMAFVGYLPLALASHLDDRFDVGPASAVAPAIFFCTFGFIAVLSVQSVIPENATVLLGTAGLVLAALLAAVLSVLSVVDERERLRENLRRAVGAAGYAELLASAALVVALFPLVAFPADPAVAGGQLNLYAHLLGYALGFTVTYATVEVGTWLGIAPA